MSCIRGNIVEEINENVTSKFDIVDNRDNHLFQTISIAYTVDKDVDAKYPERNFLKVVPEKVSKKKYDTLILQGGCNEISNLRVGQEFSSDDVSAWQEKIRLSRTKLFNLAEDCLEKEKELNNVIILTSLPRYDPEEVDPHAIKSKLNQYGNSVYTSLWMQRECPKNITIKDQKLDCQGDLRNKRFGSPDAPTYDGKPWDGIHMRGRLSSRHYTNSVSRIFAEQFPCLRVDWDAGKSCDLNYHNSCPQT